MSSTNAAENLQGLTLDTGWDVGPPVPQATWSHRRILLGLLHRDQKRPLVFPEGYNFAPFMSLATQHGTQRPIVDVVGEMLDAYRYERDLSLCVNAAASTRWRSSKMRVNSARTHNHRRTVSALRYSRRRRYQVPTFVCICAGVGLETAFTSQRCSWPQAATRNRRIPSGPKAGLWLAGKVEKIVKWCAASGRMCRYHGRRERRARRFGGGPARAGFLEKLQRENAKLIDDLDRTTRDLDRTTRRPGPHHPRPGPHHPRPRPLEATQRRPQETTR